MNMVFGVMMAGGMLWGLMSGRAEETSGAMLEAAAQGVSLAVAMAGSFALWCGLLSVAKQAGALKLFERLLRPVLRTLFSDVADEKASSAISLNLSANMLGLGNAATPMGLEAMRLLAPGCSDGRASDAMCMFLVINASSVQLLPTTVMSLRAAVGSNQPAAIVLPTLAASAAATLVGVVAARWMAIWGQRGARRI